MGMRKTFGNRAKVKFYYGVKGPSLTDADVKSDEMGKSHNGNGEKS